MLVLLGMVQFLLDYKTIHECSIQTFYSGKTYPHWFFLLKSFAHALVGSLVKWFADSLSAGKIVQAGTFSEICTAERDIRLEMGSAHIWLFCQFLYSETTNIPFPFLQPGVNFFVQNLESENCLVVPPYLLLFAPSIIRVFWGYHRDTNLWPSSSWWPLLTSKYKQLM